MLALGFTGFNVTESWCMFRETSVPEAATGSSHTPNEGGDDRTLAQFSLGNLLR